MADLVAELVTITALWACRSGIRRRPSSISAVLPPSWTVLTTSDKGGDMRIISRWWALGAILFGVLPLVGAVFAVLCLKHDQRSKRKVLALAAIAIMLAGAMLGLVFSMNFWFKVPFERWLGR